jgi:uroporphyrinogen III methyltransferase / synthase
LLAVRGDLAAGAYAWVVLPSQNAGRLLLGELEHARVVCGAASAHVLGLRPTIKLERFSASAALEALQPVVRAGQRVLVPRAADSRDELIAGLATLGAHVDAPIAYRTVAVDPAALVEAAARVRSGDVSVVTVCSPSAMESLLRAIGRELLLKTTLICLGETTADAARQAGLRVASVAEKTTMASLVNAVVA